MSDQSLEQRKLVKVPSDAERSTDYHLQSMRSAWLLGQIGGVAFKDSHLASRAVGALMQRGMTEEQVITSYKERFGGQPVA